MYVVKLSSRFRSKRPSLKWRLLHLFTGMVLLALLLAAVFVVQNGRVAIRREGDSFAKFSVWMLKRALASGGGGRHERQRLDNLIAHLNSMRHVKITRIGEHQDVEDFLPVGNIPATQDAPRWFARLMIAGQEEFYHVVLDARPQPGQILVMTDPSDETDEVWADMLPLAWVAAGLVVLAWILLYAAVKYSLAPLADLAAGLERLQRGDFSGRVREDVVRELYHIHQRFNWMSAVLRKTMRDNRELAERMVVLGEEERLSVARELHDGLSPCVFSIKMNIAAARGDSHEETRLRQIAATVAEIEQVIRRMLRRLRPAAIDEFGLKASLHDMVTFWQSRFPSMEWTLECEGAIDDLAGTQQVTVYRIVQECATNVVKHAQATEVHVSVTCSSVVEGLATTQRLEIVVQDNGKGMPSSGHDGFGLRGMQERVRALGGSLERSAVDGGGLRVRVDLPIRE